MYMIEGQEYRSVCCGVVDKSTASAVAITTVPTRSTQSTVVSNVDTQSTAGVSYCE